MPKAASSNSSNTFLVTPSFAGFPEAARRRLRAFLDTADGASPYQDPLFFGGLHQRENYLLIEREGRPVFFALGVENPALSRFLPGLRALIVHKGPVAEDADALMSGLRALKELAEKRGLCEIQISPQIREEKADDLHHICGMLGFQSQASQPYSTLILDVSGSYEKILAGFHSKTRYNVRRADRIGITVRQASTEGDFLQFYQIYEQRGLQKGFSPAVTASEFMTLSERIQASSDRGALFLSEYKGDILAGDVFLRAGPRILGLLAAIAADNHGRLPRLYPLIGRAIEWAKEIGCSEFDFGGFGPAGDPTVRQFKESFGGQLRTFAPSYNLTLRTLVPRLRGVKRFFRR